MFINKERKCVSEKGIEVWERERIVSTEVLEKMDGDEI